MYKVKCEESDFKLRKYFHRRVHNLSIKQELQEFGTFDANDLSDDPFQPSIEVDVNILNDGAVDDVKTTVRQNAKSLAKQLKSPSEFKCDTCDRTFAKQNHLNLHMQSHLKKEFHCEHCDEMFTNKRSLKAHETTAHPSSTTSSSVTK